MQVSCRFPAHPHGLTACSDGSTAHAGLVGAHPLPPDEQRATEGTLSGASKKQVKLRSSDEQVFEVDEEVAMQSSTLKNMIDGALS